VKCIQGDEVKKDCDALTHVTSPTPILARGEGRQEKKQAIVSLCHAQVV